MIMALAYDEDYKRYPCNCGAKECVGFILREGSRWRIKKFQKRNKI